MSIFEAALESVIDMNHELILLSRQIDWTVVETEFAEFYSADKFNLLVNAEEISKKEMRLVMIDSAVQEKIIWQL